MFCTRRSLPRLYRRAAHLSAIPLYRVRFFYIGFTMLGQAYLVISVSFYVILASFSLFLATLEEFWQFIHKFPQYADTNKPAEKAGLFGENGGMVGYHIPGAAMISGELGRF